MKSRIFGVALAALLLTRPLPAQTPLINYQGRIVVGSTNFDGSGYFKFALVNQDGSESFWSNDRSSAQGSEPGTPVSLTVTKGLYSVLLGDNSLGAAMRTLGAPDLNHPDVRLRVWFSTAASGPFELLTPDQRLAPAAYLADGIVNATNIADGAITTAKIAPSFTIAGNQITPRTLDYSHLLTAQLTPGAGQVLGFDGTSLNWVAPGGGGGNGNFWAPSGGNIYYSSGNVAIGTAIATHRLTVAGGPTWTSNGWTGALALPNASAIGWAANGAGQSFGMGHTNTGFAIFRSLSNPGSNANPALYDMFISDAGNVGIGTGVTSPLTKLAVSGGTTQPGLSVSAEWVPNQHANIELTGERPTVKWSAPTGSFPAFGTRSWIAHVGTTRGLEFWTRSQTLTTDSGWLSRATLQTDGSLNLVGNLTANGDATAARLFANGDATATRLFLRADPDAPTNAAVLCQNASVTTFIPYNTATARPLNLLVRDASVRKLTIYGGADLAEPFPMKEEELEKGSVVVIDEEHPGRLKRSGEAYDTRVAGIISGANGVHPGIALQQEGLIEGGQNVALSGRVYVRADATSAPIRPGDLLTTSATPGHAMKVTEHTRAQGAVIGKAMSSLAEGTGLVLVLVSLQ